MSLPFCEKGAQLFSAGRPVGLIGRVERRCSPPKERTCHRRSPGTRPARLVRCFRELSLVCDRRVHDHGDGSHQQRQQLWQRRRERFHPERKHGLQSDERELGNRGSCRASFWKNSSLQNACRLSANRPAGEKSPAGRRRLRPCAIRSRANAGRSAYEPVPNWLLTLVNVEEAFVPTA